MWCLGGLGSDGCAMRILYRSWICTKKEGARSNYGCGNSSSLEIISFFFFLISFYSLVGLRGMEKKKIHLIKWSELCKSIVEGG